MAGRLLLSNIDLLLRTGGEELLKKTDVLANTFQEEKCVEDHLLSFQRCYVGVALGFNSWMNSMCNLVLQDLIQDKELRRVWIKVR